MGSKENRSTYDFMKAQLRNTIELCIENVQGLLDSADRLHKVQYALGFYMYAVEEYGKAQLLKMHLAGKRNHFLIPRWIFGWGHPASRNTSHNEKLQKGFNNPPLDWKAN